MSGAPQVSRVLSGHSVSHAELLPAELVAKVPHREKLVLSFVLSYLEANSLPAQLLVNGGYVRDLLLGKPPDDLDLSLCLRDCDPSVSVATVMHGLPGFARERPELNVSSVAITTILSDTSKDKNVDTAKAHMLVGSPAERLEVDFMPTIGDETYDEFDRVPQRDVRGTPEQDALRRDLTIGAMLLHVFHSPGSMPTAPGGSGCSPDEAADAMGWRLLDYYGGLADLQAHVLRSPYPVGADIDLVRASVLRSEEEVELARKLRIIGFPPLDPDVMAVSPAGARPGASRDRELQALWWIKVLRDDPLRVLRALRFSAKLGFALHPAFWLAVPFALNSLQSKVAGSRKKDELVKLAKAGREPLLIFFDLAFGFPLPLPTGGSGGHLPCLAPALFGGADPKGNAQFLSPAILQPAAGADAALRRRWLASDAPPPAVDAMVAGGSAELPVLGPPPPYVSPAMRAAAAALEMHISDEEALGATLAAAVYACALEGHAAQAAGDCAEAGGGSTDGGGGGGNGGSGADACGSGASGERGPEFAEDDAAAAAADRAASEVLSACDGLSSSNEMRQAAHTPLVCVRAMLLPPPQVGMHALFAAAARARGAPADLGGAEFCALVHMWETLKLANAHKRSPGYLPDFILALAATRCADGTAEALRGRLRTLSLEGPAISGEALDALPTLPPHLRGSLLSCLHVMCRIDGHVGPLVEAPALSAFLHDRALTDALDAEWYADGGAGAAAAVAAGPKAKSGRELREAYLSTSVRAKPRRPKR
jgi:uncharacterized membrane protein YgcG